MKIFRIFLLPAALAVAAVLGAAAMLPEGQATAGNGGVRSWVERHFARGMVPPFSFVYGGKSSESFIKDWEYRAEKKDTSEPNAAEYVYTYTDRRTGLSVKCTVTCFDDFPAVEWVLRFSNASKADSPIIEKAAAIDGPFVFEGQGTFILHHALGSDGERRDFQPVDEPLQRGRNVYLTPSRGRSSDTTAFPFFNIEGPGGRGIMVAVGWTGKWYADILQSGGKTVTLKAGMERMELSLRPEEEIRTPRICLLFWEGEDRMVGHNLFRRFILAHHSPRINGRPAEYPLAGSFDYGDPAPCDEYNCLTAEYAVALVKRYRQFGLLPEVFWLDAGWYEGCGWNKEKGSWWQNVGNWTVDRERFPNGLRPIANAVHEAGARFMVWFEPERVRPGTMIDREHPDWLLKLPGNDNYLFDLGNEEARSWLTGYLGDLIAREGIDNYRQDFNFDPYPYWQAHDKPGRVGISEIRHIEGLYAFWDALRERFPGLLIDNCASGGRRIDLETTSRSAPLWRTDYQYGEPNGYQCHTFGLNFYLPVHGTAIYKSDAYTFRSGLGATAVANWEVTGRDSEPIPAMQGRIRDFKDLRPYYYGDYYPLTEARNNTGDNVWLAYQMDRPEHKDGIILAFRRAGSGVECLRVKPRRLDGKAAYELFYEDYGLRVRTTGREIMDGLDLHVPQRPASLLIRYKVIEQENK